MLGIIVAILVLSMVIVIHELGHFLAARRAGILCHEFSLGMGPVLYSKKIGETTYAIRLIPLGGYVSMAGEEIESDIVKPGDKIRIVVNNNNNIEKIILDHMDENYSEYEVITVEKVDLKAVEGGPLFINQYAVRKDAHYILNGKEIQIAPADRNFNFKNKRQRFLAIFGGPFMNFVLAFFVFVLFAMLAGFSNTDSPEVGFVGETYPAGGKLLEGDIIVEVDHDKVFSWDEIVEVLNDNVSDRKIEFIVDRNGTLETVYITPTIYFYSVGFHSAINVENELEVGPIIEGTKVHKAGMIEGDQIVSINGTVMNSWDDVVRFMEDVDMETLEFVVLRDGSNVTLDSIEPWGQDVLDNQGLSKVQSIVGINPITEFKFFKSIGYGFTGIKNSSTMIFDTLHLLFSSNQVGAGDLAGPVGIYQITSNALEGGFINLLGWIGLLSVNLGVINLLPIPALDGGRLVFLGWEAITGKKANAKIENTIHYVMYLALLGLFVFITYNDILRLFGLK